MVICYYCGEEGHKSRECTKEKTSALKVKQKIGGYFENYISENIFCPDCNGKLHRLADNSPSLDLVCSECLKKIEVKSKCLSVNELPSDIYVKHGNLNYYRKRLVFDKLSLFLIIYGYDRRLKELLIRKIYYLSNKMLLDNRYVRIEKVMKKNTLQCSLTFNNIPEKFNILYKPIKLIKN